MAIVKKKVKKKNFSIIDNGGILDRSLSWQATGLWTWLMSKPDDWEVNLENLCSSKTNGKDSTLSTLSELEQAGYLIYQRWRNSNGQFESAYTVFESPEQLNEWRAEADATELGSIAKVSKAKTRYRKPATENPQWINHSGKPAVENPQWKTRSGKTTAEKPTQLNIDIQSTELVSTELVSTELVSTELGVPCSPQGDADEFDLAAIEFLDTEKLQIDPSLNPTNQLSLFTEQIDSSEDKNSERRVATKQKPKTDYQLLVNLYNEYKPALWRKCQLNPAREKALKREFNLFGEELAQKMIDALKWAETDDFWSGRKNSRVNSNKKFDLDSLLRESRIQAWADNFNEDEAEQVFTATHSGYSSAHVALVNEIYENIKDL